MSDSGGANSAGVGALPSDPNQPLTNLSAVSSRMDSLQRFLSDSISRNVLLDPLQMDMVSSEISSAIHQAILSASSLLSLSRLPPNPTIPQSKPLQSQSKHPQSQSQPKPPQSKPVEDEIIDHGDYEVIELDSVELLAEHVHFCDICGKGFKRDANLRMHMRAHGDEFKRPEALAKPPPAPSPETSLNNLKEARFSCPFAGCNRNQHHRKFRALKSVICVRNHFKRSHCPKMYSCNRCNKKSFSVLADLKSHLKNCCESKWRCSCGTTFSRKDKLFGHMALFEGHMPAIGGGGVVLVDDDDSRSKTPSTPAFMEEDEVVATSAPAPAPAPSRVVDDAFFDDGMFADQLPGIDDRYIQQMFGSSSSPDFVHQFYNM